MVRFLEYFESTRRISQREFHDKFGTACLHTLLPRLTLVAEFLISRPVLAFASYVRTAMAGEREIETVEFGPHLYPEQIYPLPSGVEGVWTPSGIAIRILNRIEALEDQFLVLIRDSNTRIFYLENITVAIDRSRHLYRAVVGRSLYTRFGQALP